MNWTEAMESIGRVLDIRLFSIAGTEVTLATLIAFVLILVATVWISRALQRAVERVLEARDVRDEGTIGATRRLLHYSVMLVGFGIAFHTLGINLGTFFAAGAIFAVAIGFAMQNITSNFVSGILLLSERAIKPGDVLEVEGQMVRVRDMGIRATVVRTMDDEEVILPNSVLVQSAVKNFTFRDDILRVRVLVGVSYGSDLALVRKVLEECARNLEARTLKHEPVILLTDFGTSSVDYEVSVWIEDPWKCRTVRSNLREVIWWALKEADIVIAYPQVDVHLDERVVGALEKPEPVA